MLSTLLLWKAGTSALCIILGAHIVVSGLELSLPKADLLDIQEEAEEVKRGNILKVEGVYGV